MKMAQATTPPSQKAGFLRLPDIRLPGNLETLNPQPPQKARFLAVLNTDGIGGHVEKLALFRGAPHKSGI